MVKKIIIVFILFLAICFYAAPKVEKETYVEPPLKDPVYQLVDTQYPTSEYYYSMCLQNSVNFSYSNFDNFEQTINLNSKDFKKMPYYFTGRQLEKKTKDSYDTDPNSIWIIYTLKDGDMSPIVAYFPTIYSNYDKYSVFEIWGNLRGKKDPYSIAELISDDYTSIDVVKLVVNSVLIFDNYKSEYFYNLFR